jgi:hypothetical protein
LTLPFLEVLAPKSYIQFPEAVARKKGKKKFGILKCEKSITISKAFHLPLSIK